MNRTTSGIVLSEFVLSGDPLYMNFMRNYITRLTLKNTHNTWDLKRTGHELLTKLSYRVSDELPPAKITLVGIFVEITQILANCDFSLYVPCSHCSRPEYYSILDPFVQRSQYIRIKFLHHKQSENPWVCYLLHCK